MKVEDNVGLRIDSYIAMKKDISRSKAQRLIKEGNVLVNGNIATVKYPVKLNDEIEVLDVFNYEQDIVGEDIDLDIIYEDEYLLIINKKSGMVVHPAPGHYSGTLVNALVYKFGISCGEKDRPGIVHRLDKDTSGLMVVAKTEEVLEKLATMISKKEVERCYLAIVKGVIKEESATIDAPIGRDVNNRQKMSVTDANGKDSITHLKVLERFDDATLIECKLETGRTHQIRVHLNYIGHPVLNDPLYSKNKATEFGQMLHSKSIRFIHPITKNELFFESEVPIEFQNKLEELRER